MDQVKLDLEEICKDRSTENFYKKIGLEDFHKKFKSNRNTLVDYLAPYMRHPKLKDYYLLENHNKLQLNSKKTYIKYIKIDDAIAGNFRSDHIKVGGVLIGCGRAINNKFVESDDPSQWIILRLKYYSSTNAIKIVHINVLKCYVFFRNF
jgi:hypothetical protein